jgi:hypothetical protein
LNFGLLLRLQRRHGLLAAAVAACIAKNQAATSQVHKLETRLNAPQTWPGKPAAAGWPAGKMLCRQQPVRQDFSLE